VRLITIFDGQVITITDGAF